MNRIIWLLLLIIVQFDAQSQWQNQGPSTQTKWQNVPHQRYELDRGQLIQNLLQARTGVEISLPTPNDGLMTFAFTESSIMAPSLQARYPHIRTYRGVDSAGQNARMSITDKGIHAIIFSKQGTIYIDPEMDGSSKLISYFRKDYLTNNEKPFFEELPIDSKTDAAPIHIRKALSRSSGTTMRNYRIAIAADSTYTNFHGGTVADALAAIVTTLNRVTGIYENELAITFELIANNDLIIYTSSGNDPYAGLSTSQMLNVNQQVLDDVIGNENYDIGHVFTTGSGGLAGLGVVCRRFGKARGTTGINSPVGDPFDVDFVAHEIGHQFGGNHTYNGTRGSCDDNRNPGTAYEPGSGSTIMAYAGICDSDNLQNNSDAYFHSGSLEEIFTYIENGAGANCAARSATGNTPPSVSAPAGGFTIPVRTPFMLQAEGSDDDGDQVTYTWEQIDLGAAGPPSGDSDGPIFRSQPPSTSPLRYFPRINDILDGTSQFGEDLPTITREMNLRVTARDNNINGGGTNSADISFDVTDNAGPFAVTSQSSASTLPGGKAQLITWDVANTNSSPINCREVDILLSTDGGVTFDEIIAEATPNDGEEYVQLPNISTSQGRLMIRAADNVFFNVNAADFTIEETLDPDFTILVNNLPQATCGDELSIDLQVVGLNGFSEDVSLTIDTQDTDIEASSTEVTITPGNTSSIQFTNSGDGGEGNVRVVARAGELENTIDVGLLFLTAPQEAPSLISPVDKATAVPLNGTLDWSNVDGNETYRLQVALDDQFEDLAISQTGLSINEFTVTSPLRSNTTYFWRVKAENICGTSRFSETNRFITVGNASNTYSASDLPIRISDNATISSTIEVPDDFIVSDVNVSDLVISHTFIRDLRIQLQSPTGRVVTLIEQICAGDDDLDLSLDDEGNDNASIPCPPVDGGSYQPGNPLSAFDGAPSIGTWTLIVTDLARDDQGTLEAWSLQLGAASDDLSLFTTPTSSTTVELEWSNVAGNQGYEIEVKSTGAFTSLATTSMNENSFVAASLEPNTSYIFRLRAILADSFSEYSNRSPVTTFPLPPEAPTGLSGDQLNSNQVTLEWTDNSRRERGFVIERSLQGTGQFEEIGRTGRDETTFVDDMAVTNTTFSYLVRAFNDGGVSESSNEFVLAVLGTNNQNITNSIYPNPVQRQLFIEGSNLVDLYEIIDMYGRLVVQAQPLTSASIDVSNLKPGLYFLGLRGADGINFLRFYKSD